MCTNGGLSCSEKQCGSRSGGACNFTSLFIETFRSMKAAILVDTRTGTSTSLGMAALLCYCSDIALVILRPELHQQWDMGIQNQP